MDQVKEMPVAIMIGGNHHNALGLARSFWANGLAAYGIIVCPPDGPQRSFLTHSRCFRKTWIVPSEKAAIDLMLAEFATAKLKPVVFPCSDRAEEELDQRLDELKSNFIVPSLNGKPGAVRQLMDKYAQVEFCQRHGLRMAKSYVITLDEPKMPDDMVYPCILKPVTSAEGEKKDIRKCDNASECIAYMHDLKKKGYSRIMVQEYIDFDKEFVVIGSVGKECAYIIGEKIRIYPTIGGSSSYVGIVVDKKIQSVCHRIVEALKQEGYDGLFDIELFKRGTGIYINEINWRNSGVGFYALGTGVHYGVIWYLNKCGCDTSHIKHTTDDTSQYAMNEATDLRHVVFGHLPLRTFIHDWRRTQSFAIWYSHDIGPVVWQYAHLAWEMVKRLAGRK